ncbi:MAG: lipopolysaccharide heptosyltransferase [Pseudomonadota bacterium]|jgi:heptosyltransferase-2|nr:lipopolysaccharide heptosyltransferase II [Burkholderiales bacterium]
MKYKILIIAPAWVGDIVMAQTLFKLLKKQYQDNLIIDVYANAWAQDLLLRMPEVNSVIINPFNHGEFAFFKRLKQGLKLKQHGYNQVFILPNSLKSALVPFFARIKKRTAFVGESRYGLVNDIYKLNKNLLPLMIQRFCAMAVAGKALDQIDWPKLNANLTMQQNLINKFALNSNKPIIAICPGAEFGPAKKWPSTYFAILTQLIVENNYQVIILGTNKDKALGDEIVAMGSNSVFNLCGATSLADVIDLIAYATAVVTNDSGLMHIAAATDTKVVAIYGSTSPEFTPPLSSKAVILQKKISCSPCFQRTCKYGHYNCLHLIHPHEVYTALNI